MAAIILLRLAVILFTIHTLQIAAIMEQEQEEEEEEEEEEIQTPTIRQ